MVQTLFNEVRRLGTEQSNNLQEVQRLRAEQLLTVPPVEPMHRSTRNHRHENWEAACVFR